MRRLILSFAFFFVTIHGHTQYLGANDGIYAVYDKPKENTTQMFLMGDSSRVYYVANEPLARQKDAVDIKISKGTQFIYFFFNEDDTEKIRLHTSQNIGGKIGYVWLESLRLVSTVREEVNNGVIEVSSRDTYRIDTESLDFENDP